MGVQKLSRESKASVFFRKDGSLRLRRTTIGNLHRKSWFSTLVQIPWWKFWLLLFGIYLLLNLFFALLYYFIGTHHLEGVAKTSSEAINFMEVFFFSAQTFTTVGYGHISPDGFWTNVVVTIEAFLGLLSFAMASGLFYIRFARPKAFVHFSNKALIAPYKDGKALMFRVVPYKEHSLIEARISLTLVPADFDAEGFVSLPLVTETIDVFLMQWTVIHPIAAGSPFFNRSMEEIKKDFSEIHIFFKAHDELYANPVVAQTSYAIDEIVDNARFSQMHSVSGNEKRITLNLDQLNAYEKL